MANRQSKIEKYGLADRVEELMKGGVTTAARIAVILREENPSITLSDSAVARYIKDLKGTLKDDDRTILRDHVAEHLPKDLDILEEMQLICLAFMRDAGKDQAERVAEAAAAMAGELEWWRGQLTAADDFDRTAGELIKRALLLLAIDDRRQEQRLKAMRQLNQTIDTKFKHGGLLDGDGDDGIRIHIFDPDKVQKDSDDADADGYTPFSVVDGSQ